MARATTAPSYEDFDGIGASFLSETGLNESTEFVYAEPVDAVYTRGYIIRVVRHEPESGVAVPESARNMVVLPGYRDMVVQ